MAQHIEVIARGLLQVGGQVLLCQNRKKGYSYLPGGHVEFGESAEAALQREFLEECNVQVRVGRLAQISEGIFKQGGKLRHEVNLVFHVELRRRVAIVSQEDDIDFHWLPRRRVRGADIRPGSAKALLLARSRGVRFDSVDA